VRIAITGASGLIGSALRRRLEADGHVAVPMVRREPGPGEIGWDPAAGRLDPADLSGLDGVVNLAGAGIGDKRWTTQRKREIVESRTEGTRLLAEAMAAVDDRPPVLVSGSAIGYYGDRGDEVLTEASAPGEDFLAGLCREWETATAVAEAAGVRVAHVRTGIVLSRAGGALAKLLPLFRVGLGGRMGSGDQWMSWIALDDEVGAIAFLLTHDVSGPVNLTAPDPVTNAQLAKALGAELHRPAAVPVPAFGPRLVLGRELADSLLFVSQRVRPAVLEEAGYDFSHPLLAGALEHALTGGTR
jgi:uncharacterized protein (TIGR01777 family)